MRVLHVNDAASTARRILDRAAHDDQPWSFLPRAVADPRWEGAAGRLRFAARGALWLARLHARSLSVDLLHIHSGAMLKHMRSVRKPFVLHLHGTDIRTLQYDPAWRDSILWGVRRARAVLYSTPDLAQHILPLRRDAILLPVPITLADLPLRDVAAERFVFFSSRWDASKGLEEQLTVARRLRIALPDDVAVVGLDWGHGASEAAAAGVRLVPKMSPPEYLRFMSRASAVVGQSAGILASSELEAIGMNIPVYASLKPGYYDDPPVGGGATAWRQPERLADTIIAGMTREAESPNGAEWIRRTHETELAYRTLVGLYPRLIGRAALE